MKAILNASRLRLQIAQDSQTKWANEKRREVKVAVGHKVWLSTEHLPLSYVNVCQQGSTKLRYHWSVLDISNAQRGTPRPAWTAAGRCPYGRYRVAQVANRHRRHLGPATSRPLRADARKALSGAGDQWPPVTSRPGGGKLPPKDLEAGDW